MEELKTCPVCNSVNFEPFIKAKDYSVSTEVFSIVSCKSCGFKFTNPRPKEADLSAYYKTEAYISHTDTSKGLVNKLYKVVRSFTLISKYHLVKPYLKGKYLLDIGAGTAAFINQVGKKYQKVVGIEPDTDAVEVAFKKYGIRLMPQTSLNQLESESCHVITMWHVLEHVPRLREQIEQLQRLLDRNGVIVIAVPNYKSYDAFHYQQFWAAYDLPRHLYHFDKQSIVNLFDQFGFELKSIKNMPFDSFYVSMLSEKYKTGHSNFFRAVWIGLMSLLKGSGNNTSSLIYIFGRK
jgi:2-polyprenyl-3-methyl-5-hydroxy-6-metoxy-1,4-benzoquinol methylase